jgi:hypothetical protein
MTNSTEPIILLVVEIAFVIVLTIIIALIEMVVLQLLKWGNTRQAMIASITVNIASSIVGVILLILVPEPEVWELGIAWALTVVLESLILMKLRRGAKRQNVIAALVMNLASYSILILPAYLFAGPPS